MISSIYHSPTQLLTYARFFCFSFHFPSMLRVSSNDLKPRYPSISSILRQILSTLYSIGELHGRRKSGSRCVFDRILSPTLVEQNSTITWLPGEDSKMLPARARTPRTGVFPRSRCRRMTSTGSTHARDIPVYTCHAYEQPADCQRTVRSTHVRPSTGVRAGATHWLMLASSWKEVNDVNENWREGESAGDVREAANEWISR